jgi:hypothetical protein
MTVKAIKAYGRKKGRNQEGVLEVVRKIGDRWVKLNDCQIVSGGEVIVRYHADSKSEKPNMCIMPIEEEIEDDEDEDEEEEEEDDEDDDSDDDSDEEDEEEEKPKKKKPTRIVMADFEVHPGYGNEIMRTLRKEFLVDPVALWRGLYRVGDDDYLEGDRIKVQLQGMRSTILMIGNEAMEIFPESFEAMYKGLQDEFGWGDLLFTNHRGEYVSAGYPLEGAELRVQEIIHREKCATVQLPEE